MGKFNGEFEWSQKLQVTGDGATVFESKGHANSLSDTWNVKKRLWQRWWPKQMMAKEQCLNKSFQLSLEGIKK